jgi:hypothetical protein
MNLLDPYNPMEPDPLSRLDESRRKDVAILQGILFFIGSLIIVLIMGLFSGCTVPKAVEEHHHHHYEADTAAVSRQIDGRLTQWHTEMEAFFRERLEQFVSQQQQSEHQHETIQETVTVSLDSLGREIRQEQRTISRDVSRELQTIEQHITREYESRLRSAVDSIDSAWQQRYDSLSARVVQMDSTLVTKMPVGDARPWYQKFWDRLSWLVIGAVVVAAVWVTRRWWK